ncbi:MAG: PilN domain-containing protein [Bacteroidetes bacterium]|nr:PilN domain-containing protein [Bacteroidota bacterium]
MTGSATIKKISSFASGSFSIVSNIAAPIWNILRYDFSEMVLPQKCLSVAIEQSSFSVAYINKIFSKFRVKGFKSYAVDSIYPEPEFFASSVSLAITEFGGGKADLTLSIPKSWAIVKTVEFPSTVKENLLNVISYEMDRMTPFSAEDALYDFRILKEAEGKVKILLAVTRSQLVKPYLDALANKGITVNKLTLNLSAMENLLNYMDRQPSSLYIEIYDNRYIGALFADSCSANYFDGEFNISDEKSGISKIVHEIRRAIDAYKINGISPQIYVLLKNNDSSFKETFKLLLNMPVRFLNETDIRVNFSGTKDAISYPALGGALETLWHKSKGLNLLSKGVAAKQIKPIALTIILLVVLVATGILYAAAPLYIENKRIEEIDHQIASRKDEVKKVEAIKKEIEVLQKDISTINGFKKDKHMTLGIIKEFTSITPKSTWLTRVRVTEKTVEIEGYSSSATELLPKLEASKFFQKVEFASPTFRDARLNLDRFNIKMDLENVEKL